jgi:hypothetical protein
LAAKSAATESKHRENITKADCESTAIRQRFERLQREGNAKYAKSSRI